jgi:acetyl-CoA C-acetyltransferase
VNPAAAIGGTAVGATGVRMLVDVAAQVSGEAAEMQIEGARRAATLNIGGSTATTVSFIVERSAA